MNIPALLFRRDRIKALTIDIGRLRPPSPIRPQASARYLASFSFNHPTIMFLISSSGIPAVRPMWWPCG